MTWPCPHCATPLRLRRRDLGAELICSACGHEFTAPLEPPARNPMDWRRWTRWGLAALGVGLAALATWGIAAALRSAAGRQQLAELGVGGIGSALALVFAGLLATWALSWILLPLLVWVRFNDLERRLSQLHSELRELNATARSLAARDPAARGD